MKKLMNTALVAMIIFAITVNLSAKQMKRPVTPPQIPTKQMAVPAKPQVQTKTEEELIEDAKDVLKTVPEERSYASDITGYSDEQKEAAKYIFRRLAKQEKIIATLINKKEEPLVERGWFGRIYPKPGKEKEYAEVKKELDELKVLLSKIQQNMHDQAVIAGEKWSTAYKIGLGSVLTITALGGGIYAIAGKAGLMTPSQYVPLVTTALHKWWSQVKAPTMQEIAFEYIPKAVSGLTFLLNAQALAQQIADKLSDQIAEEENNPNPNQEKLDELYAKLEEQNKKIADLEAAIAKAKK